MYLSVVKRRMPLRSERGTGAHTLPLDLSSNTLAICHLPFSFRPIPDHPCPFRTFKPTALPISQKTPRLPARPTSRLSPWPTPQCPLHSISRRRTGHSRSPLDNLCLLLSYALFFCFSLVSFCFTVPFATTRLPAFSDYITTRPSRPTRLHPCFSTVTYIQHTYPSVTPENGTIQFSDSTGLDLRYLACI